MGMDIVDWDYVLVSLGKEVRTELGKSRERRVGNSTITWRVMCW